jgi:DNA polymerase-3 subunit epsilon/exodeoxyribonuclease X
MLIFINLETTGLEEKDKICSIEIIAVDGESLHVEHDLVNESKKISSKASSINHITNEMLKDKPKFLDSNSYKFFQKNNNEDTILIAHNINFYLQMLEKSGFIYKGKCIDTLRCTKHLIPECEEFSLQFLRYELKLYRLEENESSINNALHVKLLYEYLLDISTCRDMQELSNKKVLMQKFSFGKYVGRYMEEIAMNDRGYLEWMLATISDLDEDLRYSINYYLQG